MKKSKNWSRNNAKGQRKASDFYETPFSMTKQFLKRFKLEGSIYEPCCGQKAVVKVLEKRGYEPKFTDISKGHDFLLYSGKRFDTIITNPPFSLATEIVLKAQEYSKRFVIMLLPLSYLHGIERYESWYRSSNFPLKYVYVFVRAPMLGDKLRKDGKYRTGMMHLAWYVWDKQYEGDPRIRFINNNKYVLRK